MNTANKANAKATTILLGRERVTIAMDFKVKGEIIGKAMKIGWLKLEEERGIYGNLKGDQVKFGWNILNIYLQKYLKYKIWITRRSLFIKN